MVQIAKVAQRAGQFVNTKELSQFPAIVVDIKGFDADFQNTRSKYKDKGADYKLEDRLTGDIFAYDSEGNRVKEMKNVLWAASRSTLRNLGDHVGSLVIVNASKPGDYWNVYNVDGELLDKIVKDLEKREAALQEAMKDAPSFD